ncbi:T-cell surface glycoprotein CD7 [Sarotherodon galilaeus]
MSAVCLFILILCLYGTAAGEAETGAFVQPTSSPPLITQASFKPPSSPPFRIPERCGNLTGETAAGLGHCNRRRGEYRGEQDGHGVVRRNVGKQVTIQCRSASNQDMLYLKKGLNEEEDIYFTDSNKSTVNQKFTDRLQFHGKLPNVDILIKNLTLDDTGPYWCVYKSTDQKYELKTTKGIGSVLLVVTESAADPRCPETKAEQSQSDLVLVSVVICAAVLIVVLTVFLIWIIFKTRPLRSTVKKRQVPVNDVYEDMRGTIRR